MADTYSVVPSNEKTTFISPPGLGIGGKIPPGAIDSHNGPSNVSIGTCLSESFDFPEGFVPRSPIYQLSSDAPLKKNIKLKVEHHAALKTKQDVRRMTVCIAELPCDGRSKIKFIPLSGRKFEVNGVHCDLSMRESGLLSVGSFTSKKAADIGKCINALISVDNPANWYGETDSNDVIH